MLYNYFTLLFYESYKLSKQEQQEKQENLKLNLYLYISSTSMAPQNKTKSSSGFVYELNNFTPCVNTTDAPQEFHKLMRFLGQCNLSYAMIEAPILFCEVIKEVWTTAAYNITY